MAALHIPGAWGADLPGPPGARVRAAVRGQLVAGAVWGGTPGGLSSSPGLPRVSRAQKDLPQPFSNSTPQFTMHLIIEMRFKRD